MISPRIESFSKRLRRLRKSQRKTMKEIATLLEEPVTTYREWEYGRTIQGTESYLKLADLFLLSTRELLGGAKSQANQIFQEIDAMMYSLYICQCKKRKR